MANYFFFIQSDGSAPLDLSGIKEIVKNEQLAESIKLMRDARNSAIHPLVYERDGKLYSRLSIPQLEVVINILREHGAPVERPEDDPYGQEKS